MSEHRHPFTNEEIKSLLFLDIDGVLNSTEYFKKRYEELGGGHTYPDLYEQHGSHMAHWMSDLDPAAISRLKRLIDSVPGLFIVLSSTWRILNMWDEVETFICLRSGNNWPKERRFIGQTDQLHSGIRGDEINKFIEDYDFKGKWAIVDDDNDMYPDQPSIQTPHQHGLQDEHVDRLIELLSEDN